MQIKKQIRHIAILAMLLMPYMAHAQLSSLNTFSTYSMYGMGELQTQGTAATRSMGGAGIAQRYLGGLNLLNPASYSMAIPKGVMLDFGIEGSTYFNSQYNDSGYSNSRFTTFNIRDIAIQIPIAKGLGFGLSVTPYSSVGYGLTSYESSADIGFMTNYYGGEGDITEVKFGLGYELFPGFSIGLAGQYYWGDIDRYFQVNLTTITGDGDYSSALGAGNYSVSKIKAQAGLQWTIMHDDMSGLVLGATYDIGGDIEPIYTHTVYGSSTLLSTIARYDTTQLEMDMPQQLGVGLYYQNPKMRFAADYTFQNWGNNSNYNLAISGLQVGYADVNTFRLGGEYTPNRNDVRKYRRRISYRAGASYGGYYQTFGGEELTRFGVTAGVGLPLKVAGFSKIDCGLEYGSLGNNKMVDVGGGEYVGLIKEQYFRFTIGLTLFGDDYWFQRPKYD